VAWPPPIPRGPRRTDPTPQRLSPPSSGCNPQAMQARSPHPWALPRAGTALHAGGAREVLLWHAREEAGARQ